MSWFSRQPQPNRAPATTPLAEQRHKHVGSLFQNNSGTPFSSVVEVRRLSQYRIDVKTPTIPVAITVDLPPNFPNDRPIVKCTGVRHPWISDDGYVIGCASLNEFYMHSDLGKCIREVVDELMRNPPRPSEVTPPNYGQNYYSPPPQGTRPPPRPGYPQQLPPGQGFPPTQSQMPAAQLPVRRAPEPPPTSNQAPGPVWKYRSPKMPAAFPELDKYSIEELKEFETSPEKVFEFLKKLPAVEQLQKDQDELTGENETQAGINLEHEPELKEKLDQLVEQHNVLDSLKKAFEEVETKYQLCAKELSDEMILTKLHVETQEADDEGEETAEKFLNGGTDAKDFIDDHVKKRMRYHLLKAKEEKLQKRVQGQW